MHFSPPKFIKNMFPDLLWQLPEVVGEKRAYLTFDDGPTPQITPWILDLLDKYNVKATFFCLAKNVDHHPELFQMIKERGHSVGNHTYSHQKGWGMDCGRYIQDVDFADQFIGSNLFRPPYGRIKPRQASLLASRYKLIMWSIITRDYSRYCSKEECLRNVTNYCFDGAIIVFHDSAKAFQNMSYALPRAIEQLQSEGYTLTNIELQ